MISRIQTVVVFAADVVAASDFYTTLGLPKAYEHGGVIAHQAGETRVLLHASGDQPPTAGAIELAFEVDDVHAEVERLRGAGVVVDDPIDQPWGEREARLADLDGNVLYLTQSLSGSWVD